MKPALQRAMWAVELEQAGNYEGIADRLRFHGGLEVDDVVKCSGLSPQTVRKHLNQLVADGRAVCTGASHYRHVA